MPRSNVQIVGGTYEWSAGMLNPSNQWHQLNTACYSVLAITIIAEGGTGYPSVTSIVMSGVTWTLLDRQTHTGVLYRTDQEIWAASIPAGNQSAQITVSFASGGATSFYPFGTRWNLTDVDTASPLGQVLATASEGENLVATFDSSVAGSILIAVGECDPQDYSTPSAGSGTSVVTPGNPARMCAWSTSAVSGAATLTTTGHAGSNCFRSGWEILGTNSGGGTVDLSAPAVSSDSSVSAPALGQTHALTAGAASASASVSAPTVGQVHALSAGAVSSSSTVGAPAVGQVHALTASAVSAGAAVSAPAIGQVHTLSAGAADASSSVGAPAIGQVHAFSAGAVSSDATVSAPALGINGQLAADPVSATSTVSAPALGQVHALSASAVSSDSAVSPPAIGQVHALSAGAVSCDSTVSAPALTQDIVYNLEADPVASSSAVSAPALGQVHAFAVPAVTSEASVSAPALGQVHALVAAAVAGTAVVGAPALDRNDFVDVWNNTVRAVVHAQSIDRAVVNAQSIDRATVHAA